MNYKISSNPAFPDLIIRHLQCYCKCLFFWYKHSDFYMAANDLKEFNNAVNQLMDLLPLTGH